MTTNKTYDYGHNDLSKQDMVDRHSANMEGHEAPKPEKVDNRQKSIPNPQQKPDPKQPKQPMKDGLAPKTGPANPKPNGMVKSIINPSKNPYKDNY